MVLAAALLVFRTFRERYLLLWIVGWLAYFVSRWTLHGTEGRAVQHYLIAISQAEFILAVSALDRTVDRTATNPRRRHERRVSGDSRADGIAGLPARVLWRHRGH